MYSLSKTFEILQPLYDKVKLSTSKPTQLIIRMKTFSILIFTSGQCRFMGRITSDEANSIVQSLSIIYKSILSPLYQVSQTIVLQLHSMYVPVDLYKLAYEFKNDSRVNFEPELFPALVLNHWKPLHVNVFSSGKVIILGHNACNFVNDIQTWLDVELLLLL